MRSAFIALVLALFAAAPLAAQTGMPPTAKAETVGLSTDRLKRIDEVMGRHIAANTITGAVVAVARRGKLVHYQAYGFAELEANAPMRRDTMFQMYSSTKPVTAVAVLMLIEEGKIRLEDPVSRYIPEFKGAKVAVRTGPGAYSPRPSGAPVPAHELVPAVRDLTIRDLMTHTAGLMTSDPRRVGMNAPAREPREPLASYTRRLGQVPLDFQPGSRWSYSPTVGPDVLAGIVEIVSGQRFDDFLQLRVFDPLGMTETGFVVPASKAARLAPVHRKIDGQWRRLAPAATTEAAALAGANPPSGSLGLVSTAHDYLLFESMLLNRGVGLNGRRILGARSIELMGTNLVGGLYTGEGGYARPITGHGFGLQVHVVLDQPNAETGRSNGAFGWGGYLGTMSWNDPGEEIAAVILLQQNVREVQVDFERAIRQAIID